MGQDDRPVDDSKAQAGAPYVEPMVKPSAWKTTDLASTLPSAGVGPGASNPGEPPAAHQGAAALRTPPASQVPATWQRVVPARTGKTLMGDASPVPPAPAPAQPSSDPLAFTHVPETWRQVVGPRTGATLIANPVPAAPPPPAAVLHPRTGSTLMDGPVPGPSVVASTSAATALRGTLVGNPTPADLAPGTTVLGGPGRVEAGPGPLAAPAPGATLVGNPIPAPLDAPIAHPADPALRAPVARSSAPSPAPRVVAPPESNRLARRSSHPPPPLLENEAWLGGYRVRSRLRSDAVGTEYLCRPTDDPGTRCTLKVLRARLTDDAACDAYLRFANRLAKLSHPHVVGVLDAGVYQQQPYLVRPYVDGVRLTELLAATGLQSRPSRVMLRIFQDILEGLIAIHSPRRFGGDTLHFVHGALTADHVLIRPDGRAVLSGVGEVTILGPTSSDPGQDLLALRLMINGALPGGIDEKDLRLRWFADARRGPEVRAVELLRELREMTAQANSLARGDEVVAWVRSLRVASRGPAGPSGMPAAPAPTVPVRAGVFASLRAWWKRRFRPRS